MYFNIPLTIYLFDIHGVSFLRPSFNKGLCHLALKHSVSETIEPVHSFMFPLFDPPFSEPPEFIVDKHPIKSGVFLQFYPKILDYNL